MAYQISWLERGVVLDFVGDISIEEIDQAGQALYDNERFLSCRYQLFNFDLADLSGVTLEQIRNTAQVDTEASSKYPTPSLAVVSRQAIADALIFHYKQAAEGLQIKWDIRIFKTTEEAYRWCDSLL